MLLMAQPWPAMGLSWLALTSSDMGEASGTSHRTHPCRPPITKTMPHKPHEDSEKTVCFSSSLFTLILRRAIAI